MTTHTVAELLDSAREIIDGECNCGTPEYRALDVLCQAIERLSQEVEIVTERLDVPDFRQRR